MTLSSKPTKKGFATEKNIKSGVTGNLEETAKENMGEKLKKIKEFENKLKDRWAFEGDAEFYFSVSFKSAYERNRFLKEKGIHLRPGNFLFYEELPEKIKNA